MSEPTLNRGPEEIFMGPEDCMRLLRLGDDEANGYLVRYTFQRLRAGVHDLRTRYRGKVQEVHAGDWLTIIDRLRQLAGNANRHDWTWAVDELLADERAGIHLLSTASHFKSGASNPCISGDSVPPHLKKLVRPENGLRLVRTKPAA